MGEELYHVTFAGNVEAIQRQGLLPGSGGKFGGGYAEHSRGSLFLTEPAGVYFWYHRIAATVSPFERAEETPVVLRFVPMVDEEEAMQEDELGTRDAGAEAYMFQGEVAPERLEMWDGSGWGLLNDVDPEGLVEDIQGEAALEEDDGEEWYEYDEDLLMPQELRPNPGELPPGFEGFGFEEVRESAPTPPGIRAFIRLERGDEFELKRHRWRVVKSLGDFSKWVEKADQKGKARLGYSANLESRDEPLVRVYVSKPGGSIVPDRTKLRDEGYMS
jgi:hypothetical protein